MSNSHLWVLRKLLGLILNLAIQEQGILIEFSAQIKDKQEQLINLYSELGEEALQRPPLAELLSIIREKQLNLSGEFFSLGIKESGLVNIISAVQSALAILEKNPVIPVRISTRILEQIIDEMSLLMQILETLLQEETTLFNLFLQAVDSARDLSPEFLSLAREIAFKEEIIGFKLNSLGFKEFILSQKIQAIFGIENKNFPSTIDLLQMNRLEKIEG